MRTEPRRRRGGRAAAVAVACALASWAPRVGAAPQAAPEPPSSGVVESASSRWDGSWIVTDVTVRGPDGRRVSVVEPGGSVCGLGMWVSHRDARLQPGDEVALVRERPGLRAISRAPASQATAARPATGAAVTYGVQRTSRSGRPLYHATGCLSFQLDDQGTATLQGEWQAFDDAFAAWEAASASAACSGLSFHRETVRGAPDGRDGINTIRFRDTEWCRPAEGTSPPICHSPGAVGVTRVLYVDDPQSLRDGEILETDIEINAVDFALALDGRAGAIDLASAAAHEIGHALGLDHNCGIEGGAWPRDEQGDEVPSCESAPATLAQATMYFQVPPGVTSMRTPEASDVTGLCAVVEAGCALDVVGGCAVSARSTGRGTPVSLLASLALVGGVLRATRRRRRRRGVR